MKKLLLLAVMLLLAACGNEADESGAQTPEGQNEETVESPEGESQPEEEEESSMTASELLDEASSAWGDTVSYEARQTSTICVLGVAGAKGSNAGSRLDSQRRIEEQPVRYIHPTPRR